MADAGAGRDTAESAIGEQSYVAAMRQGFERRSDLIDLLHSRPPRPAASQNHHVTPSNLAFPDRLDRIAFQGKHARRPAMKKDTVLPDQRRIDRRAFHHGTLGSKIPLWETYRRRQSSLAGAIGRKDNLLRVDSIAFPQILLERPPALALLPPVETFA